MAAPAAKRNGSARSSTAGSRLSSSSSISASTPASSSASGLRRLFVLPAPIRYLFDKFPLKIYPAEPLPQRSPSLHDIPSFFSFSTPEDAHHDRPSFNPGCLKWQTFLLFCGLDFRIVPSNNHASPSGALPFVISRSSNASGSPLVLSGRKLQQWAVNQSSVKEPQPQSRLEAYQSLIDTQIRLAWIYNLYLHPAHFTSIAHKLYVEPATSNSACQAVLDYQLKSAAELELQKWNSRIDVEDIYANADAAFEALATALSQSQWLSGEPRPSLLDASLFAYTNILLDDDAPWQELGLVQSVKKREVLVTHRDKIVSQYYTH